MTIKKERFGKVQDKEVDLFTLSNRKGMEVKIMTYGATITSISIPGKNNNREELVCGFDTLAPYFSEEYSQNAPYFGSTVGRYAGRIKDGKFNIGGKEYQLALNDEPNHLHGGVNSFSRKNWAGEIIDKKDQSVLAMTLDSPHLEEGYPGNLKVKVLFTLIETNELRIDYETATDALTPVSMTNHTYFNLSGFTEDIKNHVATIHSHKYLVPDSTNVPLGDMASVERTPADLTEGKQLGKVLRDMEQGFEHYFLFDDFSGAKPVKVATFVHPETGRSLEVFTTEPGMLFYTGYYTSDELARENGDRYGRFRAFCCETHRYPNGPNIKGAPLVFASPEKPFSSTTVFKFQW